MKKNVFMILFCLLAFGTWLSTVHASVDVRQIQDEGPVVWVPMLTDPSQLSSNSLDSRWSGPIECLIDGDVGTCIHSFHDNDVMKRNDVTEEEWLEHITTVSGGTVTDVGYHNLQVALPEAITEFSFEYRGRPGGFQDNPNHMAIYATNSDDLGSRVTNKDQDQWTKIIELTPETGNFPEYTGAEEPAYYRSQLITMPEAFKYIRFVVMGTGIENKSDWRMYASKDVTGVCWNVSEFQVYKKETAASNADALSLLVDSIGAILQKNPLKSGTDPGYMNEKMVTDFNALYDQCANAVFEETDEAVFKDLYTKLRVSYFTLLEEGLNPVETGYYYIVNAFDGYMNNQGVTKSMYEKEGTLMWETSDMESAKQLWYVEKLENSKFSIKNVATGRFMGSIEGTSAIVPSTENHEVDQNIDFEPDAAGQVHLNNVMNSQDYHTGGHNNGGGVDGQIVTWEGGANGASAWYLKRETDQAKIDRFVKEGPLAILKEKLRSSLKNADNVMAKAIDYKDYVTDESQISSNAQSTGDASAYKHLIDGDVNTGFHSVWDGVFATPIEIGTSYGWHNLQFALNEPISKMRLTMQARYSGGGYTDNPDHFTIYGTNDDALGASTAAADSSQWTEIVDMTKDKYEMLPNENYARIVYPEIDLGGSYKYLRFVVKHTTTMNPGGVREHSFMSPFATGVTFNLSEMHITELEPSATSQYHAVAGVKEAYDALDKIVKECETKLAEGNPTEELIKTLDAAITNLDTTYVDRRDVNSRMKALMEQSEDLIKSTKGSKVALIIKPEQFSTNSLDTRWSAPLGSLIDNDVNTFVHTFHDSEEMRKTDVTEDQWLDYLSQFCDGTLTDAGYHDLQVKLNAPVSEFVFEYKGRPTDCQDNPNHIDIYATNDDALGSVVTNKDQDLWTKIVELTPETGGFPAHSNDFTPAFYHSPVIKMSEPYKYIRFVVKGTTMEGMADWRMYGNKEVTGVCWNLSEFQVYSSNDAGSSQYDYIEEVRVAIDALEAICNKYKEFTTNDYNSVEPIAELTKALDNVRLSLVDTSQVVDLYDRYKALVPVTEEGEGVGYIDDYAQTEIFDAALDEARKTVSPTQPTKQEVNDAMDKMKAAYATFMSHIGTPAPYVWYNINSTSTREWATDQPIHLQDVSTGVSLKIGGYPLGGELTDVYAIWRLVPIEGVEGQYAIQSLGTGQYFGPYRGDGSGVEPLMSHEKTPYVVEYCGRGAFNIRQASVENKKDNLKTDGTNKIVLNWPSNGDYQQEWRFVDVSTETDVVNINWYPAKDINIITLPWAHEGEALLGLNPEIEAYGVNSIVSTPGAEGEAGETTLTLSSKQEFAAGEPIVLVTVAEPDENGKQPLSFMLPAAEAGAVSDTSVAVNGLNGTLQGVNIQNATKLYFNNSALTICGDSPVWIAGRGGWIDASQVTDLQGSIDKTITISGMINGVEKIEIEDANAPVNVYTIDGVLVKQNVKAADAVKNLAKGIYIVGKKKVLVK